MNDPVVCCANLLAADWIIRRKHQVELLELGLTRHRMSFDFVVPDAAVSTGRGTHLVPLLILAKTDGASFRFDLRDATGSSIPLPTRHVNSELSAEVLVYFAEQRLGTRKFAADRAEITGTLGYLARASERDALGFFVHQWFSVFEPTNLPNTYARTNHYAQDWRSILSADGTFLWLLRALAAGSLVMIEVDGDIGSRQVIKLSFDHELRDYRYRRAPRAPLTNLAQRTGIATLPITFFIPWASAESFHFEFHAPPGLEVVAEPRHLHWPHRRRLKWPHPCRSLLCV